MSISSQFWFLRRKDSLLQWTLIPALAACGMFGASFLPWLRDPLEQVYSGWALPVDIGWQFHMNILSYGLLCVLATSYIALVVLASWREFRGKHYFLHRYGSAAFLCVLPVIFLLIQYLFADVQGMQLLAQHKMQALLIGEHFGYATANDLVPVKPFLLDTATLYGRAILLLNQIGPGVMLPLLSAWLLLDYRRGMAISATPPIISTKTRQRRRLRIVLHGSGGLFLLLLLLRAPVSSGCDYEARVLLSTGAYAQALVWLDIAEAWNPELEQVAYYHRERGEALYYLHSTQLTDETRIYLASAYRQQHDYLDAYMELLGSWRGKQTPSWVVSDMDITLEGLAEYIHPLRGPLVLRPLKDDSALPWVETLMQVDGTNMFAHYLAGRIEYDLHSYTQSFAEMNVVVQQSRDPDIQSSAYTYIGLSEIGLGNDSQGRELLFKATELDSSYRNNTAREELSGLR